MAAIRSPGEAWRYKIKLSEQAIKIHNPGLQQVRRLIRPGDGRFLGDVIYDAEQGCREEGDDLLRPAMRGGQRAWMKGPLSELKERTADQLRRLPPDVRDFRSQASYPVELEERLAALKLRLICEARGRA